MLGLPKRTEVSKPLPKKAIFNQNELNTAMRNQIDADISRITIVNELTPRSINLPAGDEIKSIFVLSVALKRKEYNEQSIILLAKLIRQNVLLVLEYGGECRLAVFRTRLLSSQWKPTAEQSIELKGLNLEQVWESLIAFVGNVDWKQGDELDEQIARNARISALQAQIQRAEKVARKEVQPKKRFELHQTIQKYKKELEELTNGQAENANGEQSR